MQLKRDFLRYKNPTVINVKASHKEGPKPSLRYDESISGELLPSIARFHFNSTQQKSIQKTIF
jgi:hypothetical protein